MFFFKLKAMRNSYPRYFINNLCLHAFSQECVTEKYIFLFLNQNICNVYSKEPSYNETALLGTNKLKQKHKKLRGIL